MPPIAGFMRMAMGSVHRPCLHHSNWGSLWGTQLLGPSSDWVTIMGQTTTAQTTGSWKTWQREMFVGFMHIKSYWRWGWFVQDPTSLIEYASNPLSTRRTWLTHFLLDKQCQGGTTALFMPPLWPIMATHGFLQTARLNRTNGNHPRSSSTHTSALTCQKTHSRHPPDGAAWAFIAMISSWMAFGSRLWVNKVANALCLISTSSSATPVGNSNGILNPRMLVNV